MSLTTDHYQTIYRIHRAFEPSHWIQMEPATRNKILWDTQSVLELEEVDEATKESLRKKRQAAIALIREHISGSLQLISTP